LPSSKDKEKETFVRRNDAFSSSSNQLTLINDQIRETVDRNDNPSVFLLHLFVLDNTFTDIGYKFPSSQVRDELVTKLTGIENLSILLKYARNDREGESIYPFFEVVVNGPLASYSQLYLDSDFKEISDDFRKIPPFKNVVKIPLDWSRTEVGTYYVPLSDNQVAVDGIYKHPNFTDVVYGIQVKGGSKAERPDVIKEWKFYSNITETVVGSAKPKRMHISYVVLPRFVTAWNKSVSKWSDEDAIVDSYAKHLGLTSVQASSMTVKETGWNNKISKLYCYATSQTLPTSPKPSKKKRKSVNVAAITPESISLVLNNTSNKEGKSFIAPEDISFIVNHTTFQVLTHKLLIQNETTAHNFLGYRSSTSTLGTLDLVLRLDDGDDL
jgi:hypothetical protein